MDAIQLSQRFITKVVTLCNRTVVNYNAASKSTTDLPTFSSVGNALRNSTHE